MLPAAVPMETRAPVPWALWRDHQDGYAAPLEQQLSRRAHAAMAAGCGEAAEMIARAAAMVLVGAVAGLGRLGGGSGRCFGPPWSAVFERG